MKKVITFRQAVVTLERSREAGLLEIAPAPAELAQLADRINEADNIDVYAILPVRGKIAFTVEKETSNNELIDAVCDAIGEVFDSDIMIVNARTQAIV